MARQRKRARGISAGPKMRGTVRILFAINTTLLACLCVAAVFLTNVPVYGGEGTVNVFRDSTDELRESVFDSLVQRYCSDAVICLLEQNGVEADGELLRRTGHTPQDAQNALQANATNFRYAFGYASIEDTPAAADIAEPNDVSAAFPVRFDLIPQATNCTDAELKNLTETYTQLDRLLTASRQDAVNRRSGVQSGSVLLRYSFRGFAAENGSFVLHASKKDVAHDEIYRAARLFSVLRAVEYIVVIALLVFGLSELFLLLLVNRMAGLHAGSGKIHLHAIDRVPMYMIALFYLLAFAQAVSYLSQLGREIITSAIRFEDPAAIRSEFYLFLLLSGALSCLVLLLVNTVSVRLKTPDWLQNSVIYRALTAPSLERRMRILLTVLTLIEFGLFLLFFLLINMQDITWWGSTQNVLLDAAFTSLILLVIYGQAQGMHSSIRATHRIALEKRGAVPCEKLSGEVLRHARNINFLAHSADVETERRFVNESFGTQLINGVAENLRTPLTAVAQYVTLLQQGDLSDETEQSYITRINTLSQELKKTIEDMIRIAKASTDSLDVHAVPTDVSMMLDQALGEFYDLFRQNRLDLVAEAPQQAVQISADGEILWTAFDGILNVLLQNAVRGTRVFLGAQCADGAVELWFQGTVHPDPDAPQTDENGLHGSMGLATAKVFADLLNGNFQYTLQQDVLRASITFPVLV